MSKTQVGIVGYGGYVPRLRRVENSTDTSASRSDGGFGGKSEGAPKPHVLPSDRDADVSVDFSTRRDQALIYRLSGDYNPF